jgi:rfaE bifunctional protein nucleotidyltransferase chain/domain
MKPTWLQKKFIEPSCIEEKIANLRAQKKTIATLNGSFDLMHAGHLFIIHEASKQADVLIVALNSDSSIKRYKGANRPIVSVEHRLEMMAALEFVDYVTFFEETDPRELLAKIKPDVHVNGAEYGADCIEAEVVRVNGGRLHLAPRIAGLATSNLIEKIKQCV